MKKNKITGLVGTLVLHAIVLLLLFLVSISKPKAQEEGGVPVMLGNMEMAQGNADPYTLTDVDVLDEPQMPAEASVPEPVPETPSETEMITQEDEPTIAVPKKETPKPKTKTEIVKAKKEIVKADKEIAKAKEKSEAEKRAEAERLAAEKKAAEEGREPLLIRHFSVHNLRHTFCARLCEKDINIKVIQEIMGHADIKTTLDIYAEVTEQKKRESITSMDEKNKIF